MLVCQRRMEQALNRRHWGSEYLKLKLGQFPIRLHVMPPLWVFIAGIRIWMTDLKGNYWRERLSMPLTDNQLIIVLIIYSSPSHPLSILLAVSLKQSTEIFNGLAKSLPCWGRIETIIQATLHFYTVQVPTPLISCLREEKKNEMQTTTTVTTKYATLMRVLPKTPTWLTEHEIELIGVIDQKAQAPERTERSEGVPCVLPDWVKNPRPVALMPGTLQERVI